MATERPARVASVQVTVTPPPGLSEQRRAALLAVASHCTIHNTLHQPPEIGIALEPSVRPTGTSRTAAPGAHTGPVAVRVGPCGGGRPRRRGRP